MSLLDSLLSQFRPSAPAEDGETPPLPEPPKAAEPAPPPDPTILLLPPEHAVYRLWRLRQEQTGSLPPPAFRLEGAEDMPASWLQRELMRLLLQVNASANRRLSAAATPPAKEGEEPVPPEMDAQVEVQVSEDGMFAWLYAFPPAGAGREMDEAMLREALREKRVSYGLLEDRITSLSGEPERYFRLVLAGRGTPPVHGKDGCVVDLFPRKRERTMVMDEYNRVDYASLGFAQNVEEGGVICRVIPPVAGSDGRTVLDAGIPAKPGKAAAVPKGRNTELSEDGSKLIASRTGHVEFTGRSFQVKPVLEIGGNVDYSTGNISFLGDVHIKGDICSGFTVRAMGSVTVDGVVEAGTVEAGGDLVMVKGAQGGNRAVLRSGHSIFAKFLENCCVYAKENLQADCIINCDVYCDGGVEARSGRGTIIGGSIRAAHEVSAAVVGSRSECQTDILLGGLPCQSFDHTLLLREISEIQEELDAVECQPDSPVKLTRLSKLRVQLTTNRMKLEQAVRELERLDEAEETPGLRRLSCDVAYPGTTVSIGAEKQRLHQTVRPCLMSMVDGKLQFG